MTHPNENHSTGPPTIALSRAVNLAKQSSASSDEEIREAGSVLRSLLVSYMSCLSKYQSLHWGSGILVSDDFFDA